MSDQMIQKYKVKCGDCGSPMILKDSKHGPFYSCSRFPDCKGKHGAHPNGKPFGVPADKFTRQQRIKAHYWFDKLYEEYGMRKSEAYQWLRKQLKISPKECHIGKFDQKMCARTMIAVKFFIKEQEEGKPDEN